MLTSVCAAWFWFSLHPGSLLGLAVTGGDWMRLLRNLDSTQLQTRPALRAAGRRSIATHFMLGGLGITAGVAVGDYTLAAVGPGLLSYTAPPPVPVSRQTANISFKADSFAAT
jgi:hypothetical protein